MVMHRFRLARRRYGDFEDTHQCILENHFMALRRGLHSIVAVGKTRFVLSVEVEMPSKQHQKAHNQHEKKSALSRVEEFF